MLSFRKMTGSELFLIKQKYYDILKGIDFMIHIGSSGWSYKDWRRVFYPEDLSPQNYLSYYARHFKTVEVNNTFYRLPSEKAVYSWADQVPSDFKFSLKVSRYITHVKRMKQIHEPLKRFYGLHKILQNKMGCFLFQFPENFMFTEENAKRLLVELDPHYKNVVEFRHESWWTSEAINALRKGNFVFCTVSGFGLPEDLMVTKGTAYIRFHGSPAYAAYYTNQELSAWAAKIKAAGVKDLWVYFNNDMNAHAVENAKTFQRLLQNS